MAHDNPSTYYIVKEWVACRVNLIAVCFDFEHFEQKMHACLPE